MPASAFIVISANESLNRLVDDIERCRPQNPAVVTHIGIGKILKHEDGLYYHYSYGAKDKDSDQTDGKELSVLLANQIAQFMLKANICDGQVQLFLLENPINDENIKRAHEVCDELNKVIVEKKYVNNVQITRVLFSYDVNSLDVTTQVPHELLSEIIETQKQLVKSSSGHTSHILYLDNQDQNGAAVVNNQQEHDLLIPRMLCDFMMLYSSPDNSYNVRNAAHQDDTWMYSLGYAECMYFFEDIQRFYKLAYEKDIKLYYLNCQNDVATKPDYEQLDYEQNPLGLYERRETLKERFLDVPFSVNINDYPNSVDKQIDDTIQTLHDYINQLREEKIKEAQLADYNDFQSAIKQAIWNGQNSSDLKPDTKHEEEALKFYPEYTDRSVIYNIFLMHGADKPIYSDAVEQYQKIIKIVQTAECKILIGNSPTSSEDGTKQNPVSNNSKKSGCNLFARLFRNRHLPETTANTETPTNTQPDSHTQMLEKINTIANLLKQKEQYKKLCQFIERTECEIKDKQKQIDDFRLTSHSKSCRSLINLGKLKTYQQTQSQQHINNIINNWHQIANGKLFDLMAETTKEMERDISDYRFIDWQFPLDFVNANIDIYTLAQELHKKATPFVNSHIVSATKLNLTTHSFFHDRKKWDDDINNIKTIILPLQTTATLSAHIESKFCIFHILRMDDTIIKGLKGLQQNNTEQE